VREVGSVRTPSHEVGTVDPICPTGPPGHSPPLGSHTREVLLEFGFSDDEIAALLAQSIVTEGPG
jgi:crotonobetainyl-CoA:carnitine CoA-transferase CaiB-like acyl-CoA transferase